MLAIPSTSNFPRGPPRFTEIRPYDRLAITSVIDFLPGVIPYKSTLSAEFLPSMRRASATASMVTLFLVSTARSSDPPWIKRPSESCKPNGSSA